MDGRKLVFHRGGRHVDVYILCYIFLYVGVRLDYGATYPSSASSWVVRVGLSISGGISRSQLPHRQVMCRHLLRCVANMIDAMLADTAPTNTDISDHGTDIFTIIVLF
jgi:hypothetical protein